MERITTPLKKETLTEGAGALPVPSHGTHVSLDGMCGVTCAVVQPSSAQLCTSEISGDDRCCPGSSASLLFPIRWLCAPTLMGFCLQYFVVTLGVATDFLKKAILFMFGCAGSSLPLGLFSGCGERGLLSSRGVQASHCAGLSCCRVWPLGL